MTDDDNGLQGALWDRYLQGLLAMPTQRGKVLEVMLAAVASGGARISKGEIIIDRGAFRAADDDGLRITYESRRGKHVLKVLRPDPPAPTPPDDSQPRLTE